MAKISNDASPPQNSWPNSYIAFGDSFAAGVGAGRLYDSEVQCNKSCKRFDGSYPVILNQLHPFEQLHQGSFNFVACSGDVIDSLDKERSSSGPTQAEVVTLSIGGNDFGFANVITKCIYGRSANRDASCDDALLAAERSIQNETIWNRYRSKVQDILNNNMIRGPGPGFRSVLVITGYARYFAQPSQGDFCNGIYFPNPPLHSPGNKLRYIARQRMNDAVLLVNQKIQSEIVPVNPDQIRFVDIDPDFEGKRFCEPGRNSVETAIGANGDDVHFISLETNLQESEWVAAKTAEEVVWSEEFTNGKETVKLFNEMQQDCVFHPKHNAHNNTALLVQAAILEFAHQNGWNTNG